MTTYYTCTQITPEIYAAYLKYKPSNVTYSFHEMLGVALCIKYGEIAIYPICPNVNQRHLVEFESTVPQSHEEDINILISVEEFFSQLFILELEQ